MAKLRFRAGPEGPEPPAPTSATPTPPATGRVDVVVDTPRPRRAFRPGRALWRLVVGVFDWALVAAVVGAVIWAVGQLTLRHYLPVNAFTHRIAQAAQWEGHVVLGFFAHKKG